MDAFRITRPCHHVSRGTSDLECCLLVLEAGAEALAICRGCIRGQALAQTAPGGVRMTLPEPAPEPPLLAPAAPQPHGNFMLLTDEELQALQTPKSRSDKGSRYSVTAGGASGRWGETIWGGFGQGWEGTDDDASRAEALDEDEHDEEMLHRDIALAIASIADLLPDDGPGLDAPEPEHTNAGTEGEADSTSTTEKGNPATVDAAGREGLASAMAYVTYRYRSSRHVGLRFLLRIWPDHSDMELDLPRMTDLCSACGLTMTTTSDRSPAVALDAAARQLAKEGL